MTRVVWSETVNSKKELRDILTQYGGLKRRGVEFRTELRIATPKREMS